MLMHPDGPPGGSHSGHVHKAVRRHVTVDLKMEAWPTPQTCKKTSSPEGLIAELSR